MAVIENARCVPICVRVLVDDAARELDDNVLSSLQAPSIFNLLVELLSRRGIIEAGSLPRSTTGEIRSIDERTVRKIHGRWRGTALHGDFPTSRPKDLFSSGSHFFSSLYRLCRGLLLLQRVLATPIVLCRTHCSSRTDSRTVCYVFVLFVKGWIVTGCGRGIIYRNITVRMIHLRWEKRPNSR